MLTSLRPPSYRGADLFGAVLQISAVHPRLRRAEAWRRLQGTEQKERKERKDLYVEEDGGMPTCLKQFCRCGKLLTELVKRLHFAEEFPVDGLSGTGHVQGRINQQHDECTIWQLVWQKP